jgi:hypothetical protein
MGRWVSQTRGVLTAGVILSAILGSVGFAPDLAWSQAASPKPNLKCFKGPLKRTYGGGHWLVYACDDGKSLVVVSDKGNAAFPFYFMLSPFSGSYHVDGEGTGNKSASDAAGDELSHLSAAQIEALIGAADTVPEIR